MYLEPSGMSTGVSNSGSPETPPVGEDVVF